MTNETINHLIAIRNRLTDVTAEYPDWIAVDHIDAILRDVPQGKRADVDALLGRRAVVVDALERAHALAHAAADAGAEAEWLTPKQVAQLDNSEMTRIAKGAIENQPPIEY